MIPALCFAAPGGSGGPGLLEILILAGLVVLVIRLFQSRARDLDEDDDARDDEPPRRMGVSGDPWDRLRSKPKQPNGQDGNGKPPVTPADLKPAPVAGNAEAPKAPAEHPEPDEFLRGAKMMYNRIVTSLGEGDFDDVAQFCSPALLERLKSEPRQRVDIMLVTAVLAEQRQEDGQDKAVVTYQALERRGSEDTPQKRDSTWVFSKPSDDSTAIWKLDQILR